MNHLIVTCPWCKLFTKQDATSRGKSVGCHRCGKQFVVPVQGGRGLRPDEVPGSRSADRGSGISEPAKEETAEPTMAVRCPHCVAFYQMPSRLAGKTVQCAKCDKSFQIPQSGTLKLSPDAVKTRGGDSKPAKPGP